MSIVPWRLNVTATSGTGSNSSQQTYTFAAVPQGNQGNVSVSVPGSAAGVRWNIYVSGTLVGSTEGNAPFGPIYLGAADVVTIQGSPPPGSGSGDAALVGATGSLSDDMTPGSPIAGGGIGQTLTLLGTIPAGGTSTTVVPTPTATSLLVSSAVELSNVTVKGTTSQVQLVTGAVIPTIGMGVPNMYVFMLPGGGLDSSFAVSTSPAAGQPAYVWQSTAQTVLGAFITGPITAAGQVNVAVTDFLGSGTSVDVVPQLGEPLAPTSVSNGIAISAGEGPYNLVGPGTFNLLYLKVLAYSVTTPGAITIGVYNSSGFGLISHLGGWCLSRVPLRAGRIFEPASSGSPVTA